MEAFPLDLPCLFLRHSILSFMCSLGSYSGNLAFEFHCSAVCCGSTFCDDYGMPALAMVLAFLPLSLADFNEDV